MQLQDIRQDKRVQEIVTMALEEDLKGIGDLTSLSIVDPDVEITAVLQAREECHVAGGGVAQAVFAAVDHTLVCKQLIAEGELAPKDSVIMTIQGRAQSILTAERTALNFMQRMTGIANMTRLFVDTMQGLNTIILDTRKTTPALRVFEKYAVLCGGGQNHRMGLYDRVMIKDNHRNLWHAGDPERLDLAILAAREKFPGVDIEVEIESLAELKSALRAKPEWILLDNMSLEMMAECVVINNGISLLEASGGITLDRARAVAETGVDAISLGCLTHSAPSADLALELEGA